LDFGSSKFAGITDDKNEKVGCNSDALGSYLKVLASFLI
jgi:hypothetical protein